MAGWSEQNLQLGDVKLRVLRGGSGRPVLVLHHDIGTLDRLPFYDALAEKFDVIVPRHPGFGGRGAAELDAPPARHRRALSMDARRSRRRARQPCRARLRRLDRGRDGGAGAARLPPPRAGRRDGRQAARGRHPRPGDRQLYRLRPRRLPRPGRVRQGSTARSRPTSSSPGICAARCASASPGSRTCIRRPCRICWAACAPRRWSCGATTTRSCRGAPANSMPRSLREARLETVRDCGHCIDMEQPEALARLVTPFIDQN